MGTALAKRIQNIGYSLLHHCLNEMKDIGYEYAVIGEAGLIEFYEKSCNAMLIPLPPGKHHVIKPYIHGHTSYNVILLCSWIK